MENAVTVMPRANHCILAVLDIAPAVTEAITELAFMRMRLAKILIQKCQDFVQERVWII